jgi:hypothetical protein
VALLLVAVSGLGCFPSAVDAPASVTYEGLDYQFQRPGRYLTIDAGDLAPIGEATRVNHPFVDGTQVFAIDGVDPAAAIAMETAAGAADDLGPIGSVVVLYPDEYPSELCQYERPDSAQPVEEECGSS